jgi:hypothetical protein
MPEKNKIEEKAERAIAIADKLPRSDIGQHVIKSVDMLIIPSKSANVLVVGGGCECRYIEMVLPLSLRSYF